MNISVNIVAPELANAILALASALSLNPGLVSSNQPVSQPNNQPVPSEPQLQVVPNPIQHTSQQQVVPTAVPTAPQGQPMQQAVPTAVPTQAPPIQQVPMQQPQAVPTSAPTYDMNQLAVAATQLMDAGRQSELLSLLASFGTQSLMSLPQEHYGAFATKLRELGAKI